MSGPYRDPRRNLSFWSGWSVAFAWLLFSGLPMSGAAAHKLIPVTMQLDWKPNVQFAGLLLTKDKGPS